MSIYEEDLLKFADELANQPSTSDKTADAIDRMTVAIYRVGVHLASRVEFMGSQIGDIGQRMDDLRAQLKGD